MTVKISNKIVGYRVKKADPEAAAEHQAPVHAETKPVQMNEYIE
ncbi:MAG: NrdJb, partial [Marinobacter salsuginis]